MKPQPRTAQRLMRRALPVAGLFCLVATAVFCARPELRTVTFRTQTMGTWASLSLATTDSAAVADLALQALLSLHRTDSLMTNWTATSEVARLNREAGHGGVTVASEVGQVLALASAVSRETDGAFDITVEPLVRLWGFLQGTPQVPAAAAIAAARTDVDWRLVELDSLTGRVTYARPGVKIDLGGIAKGHGVDVVAGILRRAGVADALIDLSGNMVALGDAPEHTGWVIGIRDPQDRRPYLATLRLSDQAVATSGDYEQFVSADGERYGHILDPRRGWPAHGLSSVTVVAPRAAVADAWATALFVLGPAAARLQAQHRTDLHVVLLQPVSAGPDTLWIESDLRPQISLAPALAESLVVRTF